jgi:hypothetical protein
MRRLVMMPIVLASLFLFPVEVATAQAPKSPITDQPVRYSRVDTNAIHALWVTIKKLLTAPNGQEYFTNALQNADLPLLIGTLISAAPNDQPSILVLSMSDGITPEVTLRMKDNNGKDSHVNGPLMRGSQIQFEGVPMAFTQNPFMLTFDVTTGPKTRPTGTGQGGSVGSTPMPNSAGSR